MCKLTALALVGYFQETLLCGPSLVLARTSPGQHAMVKARRMVRCGRDHGPIRRKLAQVYDLTGLCSHPKGDHNNV
jgi:hypothetical protein